MKKIINLIRRWRYRRLYFRLFRFYAQISSKADIAGDEAAKAFHWHTAKKWHEIVSNNDASGLS